MKGVYIKQGKHLAVKMIAKKPDNQTKKERGELLETKQEQLITKKKKNYCRWFILLVAVLIYSFGFLSYGPDFIPKEKEENQKIFVSALGKNTEAVINVSGKIITFKNTWGYPTVRFVLINDYRLSKEEGRCVSYQVLFSSDQKRDCFAQAPRNENLQELRH